MEIRFLINQLIICTNCGWQKIKYPLKIANFLIVQIPKVFKCMTEAYYQLICFFTSFIINL